MGHSVFNADEGSQRLSEAMVSAVHIFHFADGMFIQRHPQSDPPATLSFRV